MTPQGDVGEIAAYADQPFAANQRTEGQIPVTEVTLNGSRRQVQRTGNRRDREVW